MNGLGKPLVVLGVILVTMGLFLMSGRDFGPLVRLPGDLHYARGNASLHFPVVTCLVISLALSLIARFFR